MFLHMAMSLALEPNAVDERKYFGLEAAACAHEHVYGVRILDEL